MDSVKCSGKGWAKLLLFGEHAAVYRYPAVGLTLPWKLSVDITFTGAAAWTVSGSGDIGASDQVAKVVKHFENRFPLLGALGGGTVTIDSDIPPGLGFGSSAALCTAVSAALASVQYSHSKCPSPSSSALWAWAHTAEQLFHGTPSGIDTGLALYRGLFSFRPQTPGLPGMSRLDGFPLHLVVGAVPRLTSAKSLIRQMREQMLSEQRATRVFMRNLGTIADQAIVILRKGDDRRTAELGVLANRAQDTLKNLGLSSPALDLLLEKARSAGALGGKLSGAGGGGAFFLLYPDAEGAREGADSLKREAANLGLHTVNTIRALEWYYPVNQAVA